MKKSCWVLKEPFSLKPMKKPRLRKELKSDWSLKKPLYLKPNDDRYKRHVKQLKEHGFSDSETWSLYCSIAQFILPRLIRFREIADGHPMGLTQDEWNAILDEMIFAFDWVLNYEEPKYEGLADKEAERQWKRYEAGMQLFVRWFRDLWW